MKNDKAKNSSKGKSNIKSNTKPSIKSNVKTNTKEATKVKPLPKYTTGNFGTDAVADDFVKDNGTNVKARVIIIVAVILAIALFLIIRSQTGVIRFKNMAEKYIESAKIKIEDKVIIEASEIEKAGYKTRIKEVCMEESYIDAEKDKDGKIKITPVIVCDKDLPTIKLNGSKTIIIEVGSKYVDSGASADLKGKDISDRVKVDASKINTKKLGVYTVVYTVEDRNANKAEVKRNVEVIDTTNPVIGLIGGNTTTVLGLTFVDPGYKASDNYDGNITSKVVVTGYVNNNVVGNYTLTYTVKDSSGNDTKVSRVVTVREPVAPGITLTGGGYYNHEAGTTWLDPGYKAIDERDGNITSKVTIAGNVAVDTLGSNLLTYSVKSSFGKVTTVKRTVNVKDTVAPTISFGSIAFKKDKSDSIDLSTYFANVTATDSFEGSVSVSVDYVALATNINTVGTYEIVFVANDSSGNLTTVRKNFVVEEDPVVINGEVDKDLSNGIFELVAKTGFDIDTNGTLSIANLTVKQKAVIGLQLELNAIACGPQVLSSCGAQSITVEGETFSLLAIETSDLLSPGFDNLKIYMFANTGYTKLFVATIYVDTDEIVIFSLVPDIDTNTVDPNNLDPTDFEQDGDEVDEMLDGSTINVPTVTE